MIKNNKSDVVITTRNIKYYREREFKCNIGDIISIDISTMPKMSHNKVIAICEICNSENEISFSKYNINHKRQNFYSCKKCSSIKSKKTCIKKYGVDSYTKTEKHKLIMKEWMSSDLFRQKSIKTQVEKNGCLYVQTDEFKEFISKFIKNKIIYLKYKNQYNCFFSNPENKNLRENGMLKNDGEKYSFNVPFIKEKIEKINLEKFGHISPFGNKDIQDKMRSEIYFRNLEKETIFKGDIYKINVFKSYRRRVRTNTEKIRRYLLEEWDGYDYYDNEYIKDYLSLDKNDRRYPTIDHKNSCFYGFINNLPPEEISQISNLCITKRFINSSKKDLNVSEFLKTI